VDGSGGENGFEPLGYVEIERAAEAVPSADGTHAFVANPSGVRSVDVSDPTNPEVVATRERILEEEGEPMEWVMDCKVHGDRLLVVAPNRSSGGYHGLALFDVSTPSDPVLTRSYRTTYPIHNCFLDGRLAYLARASGFEVVDVGPEQPRRVGRWSVTDADEAYGSVGRRFTATHDLYVQDGRAYVANWDLGTFVVDVRDPTDPEHLATVSARPVADLEDPENDDEFLEPPGNDHYVQPTDDGSILAIGMESWTIDPPADGADDPGGPSGIELWDVSDLDSPSQVGAIEPPDPPAGEQSLRDEADGYWTTAHNFDVVGDYLYSSWYQGGVRVHDVSDPSDPEQVAAWEDGEATSFWTARLAVPGEYLVASDEGAYDDPTGGLYTFPDPSDLTERPAPDATPSWTPAATPPTTTQATPTPSPTPSPDSEPTEPPDTTTDARTRTGTAAGESGPGLGVVAGLSALGLGTWRLLDDAGED